MAYRSLFDMVERTHAFQVFEGNLDAVLSDITGVLEKKRKTKKDYGILAFQSPRIIRALVDCKEDDPGNLRLLELLRAGISTSLYVYKMYDDHTTTDEVLDLRQEIAEVDRDLLERSVRQYSDDISLVASDPLFSQATARRLYELIGSEEAILFATGHGGIGTGLDVVLRYGGMGCQGSVEFYPIRFSRSEHKGYNDTRPRLTPAEIDRLRKEASGKTVLVFDENRNTGKTVETVARFISVEVAPKEDVKIVYNVNTGTGGKWVELYCDLQDYGRLTGTRSA